MTAFNTVNAQQELQKSAITVTFSCVAHSKRAKAKAPQAWAEYCQAEVGSCKKARRNRKREVRGQSLLVFVSLIFLCIEQLLRYMTICGHFWP
jgi:hypothetical protein